MSAEAPVVQRVLMQRRGMSVRLTQYAPGLIQPRHDHGGASLSVVLAGRFRERAHGGDCDLAAGAVGRKPEEWSHAVTFGPDGALILSVEGGGISEGPVEPSWSKGHDRSRSLLRLIAGGAPAELVEEAAADLAAGKPEPQPRAAPAVWLRSARDRLLEEPEVVSISGLAQASGVHRCHFARAFEAAFGIAPSAFRRRAMVDRAVRAVFIDGHPLAAAAQTAGFFDQSHLSRAVARQWGIPLGTVRRLLRDGGCNIRPRKTAADRSSSSG
jgi:AraC-like DNA-binding protein